jgi:hypothetical protein
MPPYPFVQLATLKQRAEKAARTAGRSPAGSQTHRLVPLSDANYVSQLEMMVATLKIPLERRNKRSGRTEKARIWRLPTGRFAPGSAKRLKRQRPTG